jgi:hypothetical protein
MIPVSDVNVVCYWWHLAPQLFYYTTDISDLDQLSSDCAAVDLYRA